MRNDKFDFEVFIWHIVLIGLFLIWVWIWYSIFGIFIDGMGR